MLGFRKEWLAELESHLVAYELPRTKVFLEPLDRRGIIEVVRGPARSARLRERYGLTVEDGLAEIIADDLLEDRGSAIAPTLQILLTKMWTKATEANYEHPQFSQESVPAAEARRHPAARFSRTSRSPRFASGIPRRWIPDCCWTSSALHTTPLGTANRVYRRATAAAVRPSGRHAAGHAAAVPGSVSVDRRSQHSERKHQNNAAGARYAGPARARTIRHIRQARAACARRILDNRSVDWEDDNVGTRWTKRI